MPRVAARIWGGACILEPGPSSLGALCGPHTHHIHSVEHRAEHVTFEHLAGCAEIAVAEHIAAAEGEGIHADPGGDLIRVSFEREGVVDTVASAEGAVRGGVGVDRPRDEPHRAEPVVSAECGGGHGGTENLLAAIS